MSTNHTGKETDKAGMTNGIDSEVPSSQEPNNPLTEDNEEYEYTTTGDEDNNEEIPTTRRDNDKADNEEEEEHEGEDDQVGPMLSESTKQRPSPVRQGSVRGERISNVLDLETGKMGGHRARQAVLRTQESMFPQSAGERLMKNLVKPLRNSLFVHEEDKKQEPAPRRHTGVLRNQESMRPRNTTERRREHFSKVIRDNLLFHSEEEGEEEEKEEEEGTGVSMHGRLKVEKNQHEGDVEAGPQYHLEAVHPHQRPGTRIANLLGLGTGGAMYFEDRSRGCCFGLNPNTVVMNYLHWSFRSSFAAVFLSAALGFLGLTMLFAFLIWRIGVRHPQCIGGVDFETDYFMDAFALSWTTFSTVGYGLVYSGISADKPDIMECTGITILVTIEAFFGILFASFCGAIVFGKINRIQSFAQVTFSDPIVIRYGSGVQVEDPDGQDTDDSEGKVNTKIPCPILEFRLVNRLNGTVGGEILDATISLVASIDKTQAQTMTRTTLRRRRGKKGKRKPPRRQQQAVLRQRGTTMRAISEDLLKDEEGKNVSSDEEMPFTIRRSSRTLNHPNINAEIPLLTIEPGHQSFEEDEEGYLVQRKVFSKLEVESPDHPFFKRVWIVRHKLDQDSPLLLTRTRQMVKNNNGHWPKQLNNAEGVRSSIKFDQILVSLSGTSNADANSVYAQKVYEFVDINVGYRFVNMLYRDPVDECLRADIRLINDVVEQAGGGGEPFEKINHPFRARSMSKMLVL